MRYWSGTPASRSRSSIGRCRGCRAGRPDSAPGSGRRPQGRGVRRTRPGCRTRPRAPPRGHRWPVGTRWRGVRGRHPVPGTPQELDARIAHAYQEFVASGRFTVTTADDVGRPLGRPALQQVWAGLAENPEVAPARTGGGQGPDEGRRLHRRDRACRGRGGQLLPVRRPVSARPAHPERPGPGHLERQNSPAITASRPTPRWTTTPASSFSLPNGAALPALRSSRHPRAAGALRADRPARPAIAARHGLHRALPGPPTRRTCRTCTPSSARSTTASAGGRIDIVTPPLTNRAGSCSTGWSSTTP